MNKIELHSEKRKLQIGNFFYRKNNNSVYLLTNMVGKYILISLNRGHYWCLPKENIEDVFNGDEDFVPVTEPFTVTPQ